MAGDEGTGELRLKVVMSGQLVTLTVCPTCAALVVDSELHRQWHEAQR